jgi:hypothetical protein
MSRPLSKNKRDVIEFSMVLRGFGPAATKGFFWSSCYKRFFGPAATKQDGLFRLRSFVTVPPFEKIGIDWH